MRTSPFTLMKGDYFAGLTRSRIIRWLRVQDQIRGAVAEYERTLIADRMRRGRQAKVRSAHDIRIR